MAGTRSAGTILRILIYAPDSSLRTGAHRPQNSLFHFLIPLSTFCHLPLPYVSIFFAITTYKSPSYRRKKKSPSDDQAQFRGTTILSFPTSPPFGVCGCGDGGSGGVCGGGGPSSPPPFLFLFLPPLPILGRAIAKFGPRRFWAGTGSP